MINRQIPFVDPSIDEREIMEVNKVLKSKILVESNYARSFENKFKKYTNTKHAIVCSNGTTALHLAMESSPLKPGEEVITTPFTFIATTNSILYTGNVPKFVDIETDTWNLDPVKAEEAITEKTKAIMPVHIFGLSANMKAFRDLADDKNLYLIEDAAQAFGAKIDNKHVGGFGDVGTFSLYATKNLISGEGGVLTTDDEKIANEILSLKNHGRTPLGGYKHIRIGYNARMTELSAAIADVQMDKADNLLDKRKYIASEYRKVIDEIENLSYQLIPKNYTHGNYIFAIDTRNHNIKPNIAVELFKKEKILARPIYSTLGYQQSSFKNLENWRWAQYVKYPNYNKISLKIAESVAINHFEIPIVPSLNTEEIEHVKNTISSIFS